MLWIHFGRAPNKFMSLLAFFFNYFFFSSTSHMALNATQDLSVMLTLEISWFSSLLAQSILFQWTDTPIVLWKNTICLWLKEKYRAGRGKESLTCPFFPTDIDGSSSSSITITCGKRLAQIWMLPSPVSCIQWRGSFVWPCLALGGSSVMEMADSKDFSHSIFLHVFLSSQWNLSQGLQAAGEELRLCWVLLLWLPFPSPSAEGLQGPHPASTGERRETQPAKSRLHLGSPGLGFDLTSAIRWLHAEQCWNGATVWGGNTD